MVTRRKVTSDKTQLSSARALARLFSSCVFHELGAKGKSATGASVAREAGFLPIPGQKLGDYLGEAFRELVSTLRSEYVFKNAIAERILLGRHSLSTAAMLTEFRAGTNKADAVILNGTSTVYEIKSERDKLCRLDGQLDSYRRIFDKVVVVADECHLKDLMDLLPPDVGLMILSGRYQFSTIREPKSNLYDLEPIQMFESLRRSEYLQILTHFNGWDPKGIPNGIIHETACREFANLPIESAHAGFVQALRNRARQKEQDEFILAVPKHLKALAVSLSLKKVEQDRILDALVDPVEFVFAV